MFGGLGREAPDTANPFRMHRMPTQQPPTGGAPYGSGATAPAGGDGSTPYSTPPGTPRMRPLSAITRLEREHHRCEREERRAARASDQGQEFEYQHEIGTPTEDRIRDWTTRCNAVERICREQTAVILK